MLPRRWFFVAFVVAFFAATGLFFTGVLLGPDDVTGFTTRLRATDPTLVVVVLAGSSLCGLVVGVLLMSVHGRSDQRLAIVREMLPRAFVFQSRNDIGTQDFFRWALRRPQLRFAVQFTVSVDHEGISVWTGSKDPVKEGTVSWNQVERLDVAWIPKTKYAQVYPGLEFVVRNDLYETRSQVVGVERKPRNIQMATIGAESDVRAALASIRTVRGLAPVAAPQTLRSMTPVRMPRNTAYAAQRRAFLPYAGTTATGWGIVGTGVASMITSQSAQPGTVFIIIGLIVVVPATAMYLSIERAKIRERVAGYTTLNAMELNFDQRHPRTGFVIRPANAPSLTKAEFADALRRGFR